MSDAAGTRGSIAGERLLDPALLARIDDLDLVARTVVDGFVSGLHQAVFRGVSTDFAEHRAYTPGDDVRHVDWRVYARSDRLYVKQYEVETNADLVLAVDMSASMDFQGASPVHKLHYAKLLAASLVHLGTRQRDRVGLVAFDSEVREFVPAAGRHRTQVLHALERLQAREPGDLQRALQRVGETLRRRGIVVVISDFYLEPGAAAAALAELVARGHDVIALQVLDPLERDLAADPALAEGGVLEDAESGERLPVKPAEQGEPYRDLVTAHVTEFLRQCGERRVDAVSLDTSAPLDEALRRYLLGRARLARTR